MRRTLLALSLLPLAAHMQRYDCDERASVDPADCSLTPLSFLVTLSGVDAATFDVRKASAALSAAASAGSSSFVDFSLSVPISGASTTQRVYGSTWIELADTDNKGRVTLVGNSGRDSVRVHLSRRSPTQSSLLATLYFGSFHAANASAAVKAAAATAEQLDVGTVWVVPLVGGSSTVKVSISGPPSYAAVFVVRGETALETSHALLALTGSTAGLHELLDSVGAAFQGTPSFTQNPQAPVVLLPMGTQSGSVSVNGTAVGEALSGAVSSSAAPGVWPPLNLSTTTTTTFQMQVNGSALNASDVEQAVGAGVAAAMNVSQDAVSVQSVQTSANATDGNNASTLQVIVTLQRDELYANNSSGETNSTPTTTAAGDASASVVSVDAPPAPEVVAGHPAAVASAVAAQLIAAGESADNNVTVSEPDGVRTTTDLAAVIVSADVSAAASVAEAVDDSRVVNIPPMLQTAPAPAPPPPPSEGVSVGGVLAAAALGVLVLMVL